MQSEIAKTLKNIAKGAEPFLKNGRIISYEKPYLRRKN